MDDIYDNCDYYLRHNFILSISDKVFYTYRNNNNFIPYPIIKEPLLNAMLCPFNHNINLPIPKNENEHIVDFLNYLYMTVSSTSIMYIEFSNYLGSRLKNFKIEEKN